MEDDSMLFPLGSEHNGRGEVVVDNEEEEEGVPMEASMAFSGALFGPRISINRMSDSDDNYQQPSEGEGGSVGGSAGGGFAGDTTDDDDMEATEESEENTSHGRDHASAAAEDHVETDDENSQRSLPRKPMNRRGTLVMIQEAGAAAITAAEANQETDSVLSEEDMHEYNTDSRGSFQPMEEPPPNSEDFRRMSIKTFHFMQEASIERPLSLRRRPKMKDGDNNNNDGDSDGGHALGDADSDGGHALEETDEEASESEDLVKLDVVVDNDHAGIIGKFVARKQSWEDGVLVETQSTTSSVTSAVEHASQSLEESAASERGLFSDFQQQDTAPFEGRQPQHHHTSQLSDSIFSVDHLMTDDRSVDSSPSFGGGGTPPAGPASSTSVQEILLSADIINDDDVKVLEQLKRDNLVHGIPDDEQTQNASLLYHIFSNFSTPSVTWKSTHKVLEREQTGSYERHIQDDKEAEESVVLPKDSVVNVVEKSIVLSILRCGNHQELLQLPKAFFLAFFRILIRLLTNGNDLEYNKRTMITCNWKGDDVFSGDKNGLTFRLRNASSVLNEGPRISSHGERSPMVSIDGGRDYSPIDDRQIYAMVRLQQCGTTVGSDHTDDSSYTARKLLRVFDAIKGQKGHRHLLAPVTRLLGLICTAGVSERVLRRMLTLASSPVVSSNQVPPVARLLLVRALSTATEGASRSIFFMGKTSLSHFFSFGGGKGLSRTISGLTAWPFRNDFGMAVWLRAETFEKGGVLLSVRGEDGGGIEISVVNVDESTSSDPAATSAAALVISIFDSDPGGGEAVEVQRLRVPGCVLLPRIWYHVAVRHTRSRMKGVFSLSTRQHVSIMLDGKVMLTEPLSFPRVSDDDFHSENKAAAFLQKAVRRSMSRAGMSLTVALGGSFQGQTGSLYLFHENVSDATLRAIYEVGAGTAGTIVTKGNDRHSGWDSRRGEIVRKSRLLDVGIKQDDAEDVVVSQRRQTTGDIVLDWIPASSGAIAVMDLGEAEDQEVLDLPEDLSKSAFSSKLFLVWDPSRTVSNMALDLHIGAHVKMADGGVQSWQVDGAQDVIGSIGGVQALMPLFQSLICGDIEKTWRGAEGTESARSIRISYTENGTFSKECLWSMIPDLVSLVATFVQDHGENARELLRCGGIDVIESSILTSRKVALNSSNADVLLSLFGPLTAFPRLSNTLVGSLLKLRSAGSHYIGLETKIFSRILYNIPLWFTGVDRKLFVSLDTTLIPLLSTFAKTNPDKVRDCVGIKDSVLLIKSYLDFDEEKPNEQSLSPRNWRNPFTVVERRCGTDVLLGIVFEVLATGTCVSDLAIFLNLLSYCLDCEWDESSQEMGEKTQIERKGPREERYRFAVKGCTALLLLLQIKPQVPNLFESFAQCCGSVEGTAGWILCALVNSFDDTIRSLGMRCIFAFINKTSKSPDAPLSVATAPEPEGARPPVPAEGSIANRRIQSLLAVGKGLARMGPGVRSTVLPPSKLTARVTYKLMWHLLKGHRSRFGRKSYDALIYLAVNEAGTLFSSLPSKALVLDTFIVTDDAFRGGYRINVDHRDPLSEICSNLPGKSLRNGLGIRTVMRLLRFLPSEMKDTLLADLLRLVRDDASSVASLSNLPDWQPCLFHLVSETLERFNASSRANGNDFVSTNIDFLDSNGDQETAMSTEIIEAIPTVEARLDLCLDLYATLMGHCIREGGDKALHSVEDAASLQRVCLNGQDVLFLILSRVVANLGTFGTIQLTNKNAIDSQTGDPLKRSARLVTDAILSSGTQGLEMKAAAKCWRSLRHLSAIIVSIVTKNGFGVAELFDYRNLEASAIDKISGGLNGIRLPDTGLPAVTAQEYRIFVEATGTVSSGPEVKEREIYRRLSVTLASQVLSLLDAFIFPDSLDASLPQSQLHGLDLVRNCEPGLAAQGPLIASAIRLSLLLICHLEPCGMKLLQCASRLKCLLHWALELIREATALEGFSAAFHNLTAPLDRLVLATVLQCHRTLGRCSALLSEIEATSYDKYFQSKDSQKKYYRRLLRVSLELRDVVSACFRGRNDVLRTALTEKAYGALHASLETPAAPSRNASKESLIRSFLLNAWVTGFQDVITRGNYTIPEQVEVGEAVQTSSSTPTTQGVLAIRELHDESTAIENDLEKALNNCFQRYLQTQKKWAETDLVRELEYQGDETVKKLAAKHRTDLTDANRAVAIRSIGAHSRWQGIQRKVSDPWNDTIHWRLARHTDRFGQRALLVRNRNFNNHEAASYELMLGKEREKEEIAREARLRQKEQLAEVMRRNAEAIVPYDAREFAGGDDEDDTTRMNDSDTESSVDLTEPSEDGDDTALLDDGIGESGDSVHEEDWDKIEAEDLEDDAWAKAFIWSDFESIVARFESVMIVTLQSCVEGKLLLTSHGLYFCQVGGEISVMSREMSGETAVAGAGAGAEGNDRRWRLGRLTEVLGRRYMLRSQALELFFSDSHELFLNFSGGAKERDRFHAKLRNSCKVPLLRSPKSLNPRTVFKRSKLADLWKRRKITNFQYLMEINKIAGRTFNDIMQYPVFPWILADYTSDTIDLKDSRVYRDLTKPIGALNPNRLAQLIERYGELADFLPEAERFLYGTHYSNPGLVLHFMIRQEPFTSMAIELQSGRFDCPDRLFFDIASSWKSCLTSSSDMKELVPEFFTLPEMFLNTNKFPLGSTQDGQPVGNVKLPPWAKGSAYEFVRIHRMALESEFVSQNLNHWIDLIFGYKQRGPEAEAAHNVFHYLTYEGAVDLDKMADEIDRAAAESQIQNFGQTPSQVLVKEPHPSRCSVEECWKPLMYDISVAKRLRCHTPSKQFATKKNSQGQRCAVTKINIFSDSVAVVYSDLTVGNYRWAPTGTRGKRLKPDKMHNLARTDLSRSRSVIKRGTAVPQSSDLGVGNWSFAFTLGGSTKEELRQNAVMATSRLIAPKTESLSTAEASGFLVSCGFWDNEVKVHSLAGYKLLCGDNGGHRGPVRCLAMGDDGGLMVTGGIDCTLRIWAVDHPDMGVALSDGYVQTVLGSTNDGDQLLSCCRVLWGHDSPISCVDLLSDLDLIASGSLGGVVCVHTLRLGEYVRSFRPRPMSNKPSGVSKVALHKHGKLVVHMQDYGLHTYTINGKRLSSKDAGEKLHDMRICPNGEALVTGGERCHVLIRSLHNLEILSMLDLSRHGPIRCITMTPEDLNPIPQVIMVGSDDGYVTIIDEEPNYGDDNAETSTF